MKLHLLPVIGSIAFLVTVLPARAALIEFKLAGTVTNISDFDFVVVPDFAGYTLPAVGDAFEATFTFDTDATLSSSGGGMATYGSALIDATYSLPDSNLEIFALFGPVKESNNILLFGQGETDVWEANLLDGSGIVLDSIYASDIPGDPDPDELTFDATSEMVVRLEDFGPADTFSSSVPPLVRPDDSGWLVDERTFKMSWEADLLTGNNPSVNGTIDSITVVPEPATATTVLAAISLALVARRRRLRNLVNG